jgi:hypothetical protein
MSGMRRAFTKRVSLAAVVALATLLLAHGAALAAPAAPFAEWRGEYFQKKQGGLFVKVQLKGFKGKKTQYVTGTVNIHLFDLLKKRTYVLPQPIGNIDGYPDNLRKANAGKYVVKSIELVDPNGVKRTWTGPEKKTVVVKRLSLSNMGLWTLSPSGAQGLSVKFAMIPNSYTEEGDKKESSVMAVVNGFTGLVQEKFAGKKLEAAAENNFESGNELRATITFTRQIAMFYKLNLFKHNHHAKAVAQVLAVSDPNLRTCYTNRLDFNDSLRGEVKFNFILSKQTGTMSTLKNTGGSLNDPKLIECMYYELMQIQFPVKETILGELTYTYDVR